MDQLTFAELDTQAAAFDAMVSMTPEVDRFCSSTAWVRSAQIAFVPHADPMVLRGRHGWAAFMRMPTVLGDTLVPLECSWGLASPIIGENPDALVTEVYWALHRTTRQWEALYLPGLKRGGVAFTALLHRFAVGYRVGLGQATVRHIASLSGGFEGWMSRRSKRFRKNMRRLQRRAEGSAAGRRRPRNDHAQSQHSHAEPSQCALGCDRG